MRGTSTPDLADDHAFARWIAEQAGAELLAVRGGGLQGAALKDAGDLAAHELLTSLIEHHRPLDAILSEEEHRGSTSAVPRDSTDRVWIIDPLDGTREFSEPSRRDWAVHIALWERGDLVAGAVAQPAGAGTFATGARLTVPAREPGQIRLAVSRTRPPAFVVDLAGALGAELVPMGSAGVKVASVVRGTTDAYVHAGGQYEWDSAAPVAVARHAGLHASRIDGSPLRYNQPDPWLPDLLVCRPEMADRLVRAIKHLAADARTSD